MGRYTTVQSFADNNQRVAPLPYEKASGGIKADPDSRAPGVRVSVVQNVSGSTAGAGSSHFHIYRLERRREEERVKNMDSSHESMVRNQEYHARLEANRLECEERTRKRAEKRRKSKMSKGVKKRETSALAGVAIEGDAADEDDEDTKVDVAGTAPALGPEPDDLLLDDGKFVERFLRQHGASGHPSSEPAEPSLPDVCAPMVASNAPSHTSADGSSAVRECPEPSSITTDPSACAAEK